VAYTAGDVIAPDLLLFFRSLGINLKQLYGSTETGFFVASQRNGAVRADSVGSVTDGVELKVAPNREILVRSSGLFKEYLGDPQATSDARSHDGWLHTGDAGYIGQDGQLRIIDRLKNIGALSDGSVFSPKAIENKLKFVPYIKEAVVIGDGRDKVCALIDIDGAVVGRWADKRVISYTGYADLASRDEVYDLIAESIGRLNAELEQDPELAACQVHRFAILQNEFSADDGHLTRTGKLRRDVIADRFKTLVDAMYAGQTVASVDGPSSEPGEGSAGSVDLKIRDARVSAPRQVRRAA
jgi:long-chain acyl-CoA synthetase